jgi:Flp pilus assembly protein TadD
MRFNAPAKKRKNSPNRGRLGLHKIQVSRWRPRRHGASRISRWNRMHWRIPHRRHLHWSSRWRLSLSLQSPRRHPLVPPVSMRCPRQSRGPVIGTFSDLTLDELPPLHEASTLPQGDQVADDSRREQLPSPLAEAKEFADPIQTKSEEAPGIASTKTLQANSLGQSVEMPSHAEVPRAVPPVSSVAMAEPSPKIAQEILAAKTKPPRRFSPRLIGLAIVVGVIVAINAGFFLGYFDRWLGSSDSLVGTGVAVAPPPTSVMPPANEVAPGNQNQSLGETQPKELAKPADSGAVTPETEPRAEKMLPARIPGPVAGTLGRAGEKADAAQSLAKPARNSRPVVVARKPMASPLDSAYAALTAGRFEEAAVAYRQALEKNASERDALLGLAYIAHRLGNHEEAKARYQQVLRQDPGQADALAGLLSLSADGDLAGAASRAREMAERSPESAAALASLGGILVREGRIAEAQQAFFKALALDPESALHAYNLAVSLDRLHKYAQAQVYYQRALALAEKASAAEVTGIPRQQARQRLDQLRATGVTLDSHALPDGRRD